MRPKTRQLSITVPALIWDVINSEAEKAERRLAAMGVGHYVGRGAIIERMVRKLHGAEIDRTLARYKREDAAAAKRDAVALAACKGRDE